MEQAKEPRLSGGGHQISIFLMQPDGLIQTAKTFFLFFLPHLYSHIHALKHRITDPVLQFFIVLLQSLSEQAGHDLFKLLKLVQIRVQRKQCNVRFRLFFSLRDYFLFQFCKIIRRISFSFFQLRQKYFDGLQLKATFF